MCVFFSLALDIQKFVMSTLVLCCFGIVGSEVLSAEMKRAVELAHARQEGLKLSGSVVALSYPRLDFESLESVRNALCSMGRDEVVLVVFRQDAAGDAADLSTALQILSQSLSPCGGDCHGFERVLIICWPLPYPGLDGWYGRFEEVNIFIINFFLLYYYLTTEIKPLFWALSFNAVFRCCELSSWVWCGLSTAGSSELPSQPFYI